MAKITHEGLAALKKVAVGIDKAANAAKITLGPLGCNVTYAGLGKRVVSTKDGANILEHLDSFNDELENLGLSFVKGVTKHTVDAAGDGTTTATVLFQSMVNKSLSCREAGMRPVRIAAGIRKAVDTVIEYLGQKAKPLKGPAGLDINKIREVASISVNDKKIGHVIANLMYEVGEEGIVAVEDGRTSETTTEKLEGMKFDQGFISHHFTNNKSKQTCEFENPHILIYGKKLDSPQHIEHLAMIFSNIVQGDPLLIIAEDISDSVLLFLQANSIAKRIKVCPVKAPGFGDTRNELAADIATFVGAAYITDTGEQNLDKLQKEQLGRAKKVIVTGKSTTLISGDSNPSLLKERCELIRNKIEEETSDYAKQKLHERLGKLLGKAGIIRVGGTTETDQKELKDRIDDAVQAVKAAIVGGILPGGGAMLIKARQHLEGLISQMRAGQDNTPGTAADFIAGFSVVSHALAAPLRQMLINAGLDSEWQVIINQIDRQGKDDNYGYDVLNEKHVDLMEAGIIDPFECSAAAIRNAGYSAARFIETDCTVVNEQDKNSNSKDNMMDMGY